MKNLDLEKIKNVHFIGIGGIGISAIARMMLMEGKTVSGSDSSGSTILKELQRLGVQIYKGHTANNLNNKVELVVYTTAISDDNPELLKAKKLGTPTLSYPEALGIISANKRTVAISGTHGKTTTTAMLGKILIDSGLDPTMIVGSLLKDSKSNFVAGKSDLFICEACEYKKAFLNLNPKIIVITNIDEDHLDYYKNIDEIQEAFVEFVSRLGEDDFLICNASDPTLEPVIKAAKCKIINYLECVTPSDIELQIPGGHNIQNAQAAIAVAGVLGVNQEQAVNSLKEFKSVWRRFEHKGELENGALVYDDYAHHPTEIKASLKGAREFFGNKKIWCIFQPHLFSRTKVLIDDFAKSFTDADEVIIANIYAAREKDDGSINAEILVEKIKNHQPNVQHMDSFKKIEDFMKRNAKEDGAIITMGAGDIFKIGENLIKKKRLS